jgi:hypothetical protein
MVKSAVGLFAPVPATLVHALDFFIAPARSLVLLRTWNWNKRVYRGERMSSLHVVLAEILVGTRAKFNNNSASVGGIAHAMRRAWGLQKRTVGGRCTGDTIAGAGGPEDAGWP